jgi:hypothetical protein
VHLFSCIQPQQEQQLIYSISLFAVIIIYPNTSSYPSICSIYKYIYFTNQFEQQYLQYPSDYSTVFIDTQNLQYLSIYRNYLSAIYIIYLSLSLSISLSLLSVTYVSIVNKHPNFAKTNFLQFFEKNRIFRNNEILRNFTKFSFNFVFREIGIRNFYFSIVAKEKDPVTS